MTLNIKIFFILLVCPFFSNGQIIVSVAGNGLDGYGGDGGPAIEASFKAFSGIAFDTLGNLYIADANNNRIRKVDVNTGIINTIAGTGIMGFSGDDSMAILAKLNDPKFVVCDKFGNLFISDVGNNRIRKVDLVTGVINTYAGTGSVGFSGDGGLATLALINGPQCLAFDIDGNLFFADGNNLRVREINTSSGVISTVAGDGVYGFNGDGGLADTAEMGGTEGICFDKNGNLYLTDAENLRIRKVDAITNIITTVAGNGSGGFSGDGGPATNATMTMPFAVTCDTIGNIYISDMYNSRIRKVNISGIINTIVGNGTNGFYGDGGEADTAELWYPQSTAFDHCGNFFIADLNNFRVRKVIFDSTGIPITSISSSDTNVCPSTSVIYSATVYYGSAISYEWYVDGSATGATSGTYSYIPANGDSVRCVLTGVSQCSGDTAIVSSNSIYMVVNPVTVPTITLTSSASAMVGSTVTVNATISGAGSSYDINWYDNGVLFNTTSTPTVTYTKAAGTDNITATVIPSSLLCYDSSTSGVFTITDSTTDIATFPSFSKGVSIFPNPAHTIVTIAGQNIVNVNVSNLLGQMLITEDCNCDKVNINIATLPPGVYAVKVTDSEGGKTIIKIVKE